MDKAAFQEKLKAYVPENAVAYAADLCYQPDLQLTISRARVTKLGDYRSPRTEGAFHRISVNHDLNPYSFLITLIHEIAHYRCTKEFGRKVKPHGSEWKHIFSELLKPVVDASVFPRNVLIALEKHIHSPKASSCADPLLISALSIHDSTPSLLLQDLEEGVKFQLENGRSFVKGHKRRTRFVCTELLSHKKFLVAGIAKVKRI